MLSFNYLIQLRLFKEEANKKWPVKTQAMEMNVMNVG